MKNEHIYASMKKYAAELFADGYIESGYIAAKADEGMYITTPDADFADLKEEQVAFVTDKTVEQLEGNFRAAAVVLLCALKAKKDAGAAAIVDSKSILEFSRKRMTLPPVLEDMSQICGISVRAAKKNMLPSRSGRGCHGTHPCGNLHGHACPRQIRKRLSARRKEGRHQTPQRIRSQRRAHCV